jgi:hypothetical protein
MNKTSRVMAGFTHTALPDYRTYMRVRRPIPAPPRPQQLRHQHTILLLLYHLASSPHCHRGTARRRTTPTFSKTQPCQSWALKEHCVKRPKGSPIQHIHYIFMRRLRGCCDCNFVLLKTIPSLPIYYFIQIVDQV